MSLTTMVLLFLLFGEGTRIFFPELTKPKLRPTWRYSELLKSRTSGYKRALFFPCPFVVEEAEAFEVGLVG